MAPKKATAPPATAPRRSARLASRSPSVEPEEPVSRKKSRKARSPEKPAAPLPATEEGSPMSPESKLDEEFAKARKAHREKMDKWRKEHPKSVHRWKMMEIERICRRDREEAEAAAAAAAKAKELEALPSPPHSPATPEESVAEQPNSAPAGASIATPSTVERAVGWITSWFRKRPAEEPAEQPPSAKRSRIEVHIPASEPSKKASGIQLRSKKPIKHVRRRSKEEKTTVPSPPSSSEEEEPAEYIHKTPESRPIPAVYLTDSMLGIDEKSTPVEAPTPVEEPSPTPRRILTPKSPRDYGVPSTKNPAVPTSLSTITEYTEPSMLSNFSDEMESTPSRPPRQQPGSNHLQVPQSTPARRQPTTPSMRRSATIRAARSAGNNSTPTLGFTANTAPPKPRESNADARLAKLQLRDSLKRQLDALNEDEDIKEMDSHKVKRVKIDNLVQIPHNRPGDPAGCFRLPEEDSDDEMEVYENVEERSNLFEEEEEGDDTIMDEPIFTFPEIAPIPDDYYVSEEFKEEAGRLFTEGFNAWLAAGGEDEWRAEDY